MALSVSGYPITCRRRYRSGRRGDRSARVEELTAARLGSCYAAGDVMRVYFLPAMIFSLLTSVKPISFAALSWMMRKTGLLSSQYLVHTVGSP